MDYYEEERQYKKEISQVMGDGFVDAMYDGTTSETLQSGFIRAMGIIAHNCHLPEFGVESARFILENCNPGKEYNGRVFQISAKNKENHVS